MAIQTVEAWIHGVHRNFADVILFHGLGLAAGYAAASVAGGFAAIQLATAMVRRVRVRR